MGFGDWSTQRGTFGGEFGATVNNGDFTAYVCDSITTRPSFQITLGRLVTIMTAMKAEEIIHVEKTFRSHCTMCVCAENYNKTSTYPQYRCDNWSVVPRQCHWHMLGDYSDVQLVYKALWRPVWSPEMQKTTTSCLRPYNMAFYSQCSAECNKNTNLFNSDQTCSLPCQYLGQISSCILPH